MAAHWAAMLAPESAASMVDKSGQRMAAWMDVTKVGWTESGSAVKMVDH
jgi:hypothetical protein